MSDDAPLGPGWKRYLAAFDRFLLAPTVMQRAAARADMIDRLAEQGFEPRAQPVRVANRTRPKHGACIDCGEPVRPQSERCRSCYGRKLGLSNLRAAA